MSFASAAEVMGLFGPSESDWVVTLIRKDGGVVTRRIAPGRISEEMAVRAAMNASEVMLSNLEAFTIRRASDRSLEENGDQFLAELWKKKRNS